MNGVGWIATTLRLPADGQQVLVKTRHGTVEHLVIFRAEPRPRWETSCLISELEDYAFWRRVPAEREHAAQAAHPSL
jgi:hypothetical protein